MNKLLFLVTLTVIAPLVAMDGPRSGRSHLRTFKGAGNTYQTHGQKTNSALGVVSKAVLKEFQEMGSCESEIREAVNNAENFSDGRETIRILLKLRTTLHKNVKEEIKVHAMKELQERFPIQ